MMNPASPEEIRSIVGELDPLVLEEILKIYATPNEIAEARGALEAEREGQITPQLSPRAAAVLAVLEDELDDIDDRDDPVAATA